ncbi:MAG: hypothetical protein ACOCOR_04745, partial [Prevotella sp.]
MARRRSDEWRDGGIGTGDDVGLGEPDNVTINGKGRRCFRFAPFCGFRLRRAKDCAPYRAGGRYAVDEGIIGEFDKWLAFGGDGEAAAEGVVGVGG